MRPQDSGEPPKSVAGERPSGRLDVSVVVGSVEAERSIGACLDSVVEACSDRTSEILVIDASRDRTAELAESMGTATVVRRPPGTLIPALWGEGIRRTKGRWVALTTGHCRVPPGWADALIDALLEGAAGAGAALVPNAGIGATDLAVFHLRYGAFLALSQGEKRRVPDLPGDNAAYDGDDLRRFLDVRPDHGFWEIEYHEKLRERGGYLIAVPEATAAFGPAFPFLTIMQHRFEHGRHHGRWRLQAEGQPRWRILLPAPLVPLVLLGRAARRSLGHREHRRSFLTGAVPFLALSAAWAAGEVAGAAESGRADGLGSNGS